MLETAFMIGALFLVMGVAAIRGFPRAVLGLILGGAALFLTNTWFGVVFVLSLMILTGTKPTPKIAEPEERLKRRALMDEQDQRADDLFKQASSSGEFQRPQ
jgi:hypothetical protein